MKELKLDVAATNTRAVKCYKNNGFIEYGEFWRDASDLKDIDINDSKYDFIRDHFRITNGYPQIRFYLMSKKK